MVRLAKSLSAWGTPGFETVLKQEIAQLDPAWLPLQQGLSGSSHALDRPVQAMILRVEEHVGTIRVKAGIFYSGIIAGCNCADDPTPVEENPEYCEVCLEINKTTGEAVVSLWSE